MKTPRSSGEKARLKRKRRRRHRRKRRAGVAPKDKCWWARDHRRPRVAPHTTGEELQAVEERMGEQLSLLSVLL